MGELHALIPSVDAALSAAAVVRGSGAPESRNLPSSQPKSGIAPRCRTPRDAARGVAAAVTAASKKSRKRNIIAHISGSDANGEGAPTKQFRRGSGRQSVASYVSTGAPTPDSASTPSSESLDTHAARSEETDEDDEHAAAIVAMLAAGRHSTTTRTSEDFPSVRKFHSPVFGRPSSPGGSDGSSDALETVQHLGGPSSTMDHRSPQALRRSSGKPRGFCKGVPGVSAHLSAGMTSKRQPGTAKEIAGRTRPTNNQLLYKAYFRWEHYPYKVAGDSRLTTETEACASVTSAFLQVLASLHEAESQREDAPRNILRLLSANTRRTKVVELTSGTHRVPDELRRHCLTDASCGQYSTNLDRNRYGSDNQYLNTVIRYDLDFLGLCPALVDVEIIDAKTADQSRLIRAQPHQCCCGCSPVEQPTAVAPQKQVCGSGVFDMLVAAAAADAESCSDDESPECEGEVIGLATELVGARRRIKSVVKTEGGNKQVGMRRTESVTSMAALDHPDVAALDSRAEVAQLRVRLADAEARAVGAESRLNALKNETEGLLQIRKSAEPSAAPGLEPRCAELEAKVAVLVQERDAFAAAHSYYSVWVQQLQAEVTNLLRVAYSNGGSVSNQLISLTQAVTPSLPPTLAATPSSTNVNNSPAESDADAILRAHYERQVQELVHQHFQSARQPAPTTKNATVPGSLQMALPTAQHAISMPPSSAVFSPQPTYGLNCMLPGAMEILPLQHSAPATAPSAANASATEGQPSCLNPQS
eukprot:CAMPEP_0177767558 /NCGR_PEP_ID=MMETSP0491_2-20121128/9190_1 /TAXON_ID=63592 /ORGANISM="Tetraselmis chuii, Strain PLY429" /LENGTH=759 /DNA_ID=CAMNT_0019284183 /DNA_START=121 /DNA_END=2400 /DNA_ORIENTATION=-